MTIPIKALSAAHVVVGILLCLGGFILTEILLSLRDAADKLRQMDITLAAQIAAINTVMVTREELRSEINRLRDEIRRQ